MVSTASALALFGCNSSQLPQERPSDFAFEYRHKADRSVDWKVLACDARECACEKKAAAVLSSAKTTAVPAQLDAAYAAVRKNEVDQLRTEQRPLDEGGSHFAVAVTAAGKRFELSDQTVAQGDSKRLGAIADELAALQTSLCGSMGR